MNKNVNRVGLYVCDLKPKKRGIMNRIKILKKSHVVPFGIRFSIPYASNLTFLAELKQSLDDCSAIPSACFKKTCFGFWNNEDIKFYQIETFLESNILGGITVIPKSVHCRSALIEGFWKDELYNTGKIYPLFLAIENFINTLGIKEFQIKIFREEDKKILENLGYIPLNKSKTLFVKQADLSKEVTL